MENDKVTILCVDDEEVPRKLRALVLRKQGYEVIAAGSGKEALELLNESHINLVLTDQMMPAMSGTELAKQVKAIRPELPVILISGMNEIPADVEYADRFVSKVEGPELLFRAIREVIMSSQRTH